MTDTKATASHDGAPLGLGSTDQLGPLPEPTFHGMRRGGLLREDAWTADQMRAYATQEVAAEQERHAKFVEQRTNDTDAECKRLRELLDSAYAQIRCIARAAGCVA